MLFLQIIFLFHDTYTWLRQVYSTVYFQNIGITILLCATLSDCNIIAVNRNILIVRACINFRCGSDMICAAVWNRC